MADAVLSRCAESLSQLGSDFDPRSGTFISVLCLEECDPSAEVPDSSSWSISKWYSSWRSLDRDLASFSFCFIRECAASFFKLFAGRDKKFILGNVRSGRLSPTIRSDVLLLLGRSTPAFGWSDTRNDSTFSARKVSGAAEEGFNLFREL